jgi:S1-C subfamily serine protease
MFWRGRFLALILAALLLGPALLRAGELVLKDGTVLQGTIIQQADSYWIRTADGQSRIIPASQVKSATLGSGVTAASPAGSSAFAVAKRQADLADSPLSAVAVWHKFLDSNPSPADRLAANAELEKWNKLPEDAERINGQWVSGAQRKELVDRAGTLAQEAADLIGKSQTLAAMKKLEEAVKVYPNCYPALFVLGWLDVQAKKNDEAIRCFEQALKLRPNACESLNNLGLALLAKRDYARGMDLVLKAAETEDNPDVAQNLVNVVAAVPPNVKNTVRGKAAVEAARLLAGKYKIAAANTSFRFLAPKMKGGGEPDLAGVKSAGTGFIIRADGLILTNRHVAAGGGALLVLLPGNVRKSAEVVKVDEEQDLALIQIKAEGKLPVIELAKPDMPKEGAQCFIMGYPMIDRMGASVKITQGIISGAGRASVGTDVVIDARVNPGNSGGPLLNNHAEAVGIVTMKSRASATEDSYGLAISAGRIRRFLAASNVSVATSEAGGPALDAEQVAEKAKAATVCVMAVR